MPKARISRDCRANWLNDAIQFPRLISELQAAGAFTEEVMAALRASMDLSDGEIMEIVARADKKFEDAKAKVIDALLP